MAAPKQRRRRTPKEQIADLEAQIAKIKQRAERQKVKRDPALRHMAAAVRSIDKALAASKDPASRKAMQEARTALSACLALNGAQVGASATRSSGRAALVSTIDREEVLRLVAERPGSRCEDLASVLGTDTKALSPVLKGLKSEGEVRTEGQARGTRYFAET